MSGSIRRIAMLSVHTSPLATLGGKKTGGMNVYVRDLSRELARRGIQVDIFTRRDRPDLPDSVALADRAQVIYPHCGPETPLSTTAIYPHLPEFTRGVLDYAAAHETTYDLIFSHYWLSGWVAHELRGRWACPVVQMFHTLGQMKNRVAQDEADQETSARIFTETDTLSWVDRVIAATPAERAQLLWLYRADRRKIEIVPPGVDVSRFRPLPPDEARAQVGVPRDCRMVLFVGRIEPLKGVDTLLRALARLQADEPGLTANLRTVIIGGGGEAGDTDRESARLIALRNDLGLQDLVTFVGARDQTTLPDYYSAAEMLVMPSDYESFGLVALEAMACGTPVIASEVGGLAFVVQDGVTGFHVPYRDPETLAARIRTLLIEPDLRARMSRAAHDVAQNYDWPIIAARLLGVFERTLRRWRQRAGYGETGIR